MRIKCPYCRGETQSDVKIETGEILLCPYCSRKFTFGVKVCRPTRIQLPQSSDVAGREAIPEDANASPKVDDKSHKAKAIVPKRLILHPKPGESNNPRERIGSKILCIIGIIAAAQFVTVIFLGMLFLRNDPLPPSTKKSDEHSSVAEPPQSIERHQSESPKKSPIIARVKQVENNPHDSKPEIVMRRESNIPDKAPEITFGKCKLANIKDSSNLKQKIITPIEAPTNPQGRFKHGKHSRQSKQTRTTSALPDDVLARTESFLGHRIGEIYTGEKRVDPHFPELLVECETITNRGFEGTLELHYTPIGKKLAMIWLTPVDERILARKPFDEYYGLSGYAHPEAKTFWCEEIFGGKGTGGFTISNRTYYVESRNPLACAKSRQYGLCVFDRNLASLIPHELDELQDLAIQNEKERTSGKTLISFLGVKFGSVNEEATSHAPIKIDSASKKGIGIGFYYNSLKCNKFGLFHDLSRQYFSCKRHRMYRMDVEYEEDVEYEGDRSQRVVLEVQLIDGKPLKEGGEIVMAALRKRYGKPYRLRPNSKFNIETRYGGTAFSQYMFPNGKSAVYLWQGANHPILSCVNDKEQDNALNEYYAEKKAHLEDDYEAFARGDLLGITFGSKMKADRRDGNDLDTRGFPEYREGLRLIHLPVGPHVTSGYRCRELRRLSAIVTWSSGIVTGLFAEFNSYSIYTGTEEFEILLNMLKKKFTVAPEVFKEKEGVERIERAYHFVTPKVDIMLCNGAGYGIGIVAMNKELRELALKELAVWKSKCAARAGEEILRGNQDDTIKGTREFLIGGNTGPVGYQSSKRTAQSVESIKEDHKQFKKPKGSEKGRLVAPTKKDLKTFKRGR